MIAGLFDNGSMPVLERMAQFTEARQKLLAHNVANLSTPYFKPVDVDPKGFQDELGRAIERRRRTARPTAGELRIRDTRLVDFERDGLRLRPDASNRNILFHDQNNRDLEREMQSLAENTMAFQVANDFLRSRYGILETAIRGRM